MKTSGTSTTDIAKNRVYLDYYQLNEPPFSITPDPEYLFYSTTHRNAIDKLLYGINSAMGFLLLVGEVGTGKTTICRALLDNLADQASTVYIINPSLSGQELMSSILDDLGIHHSNNATKKDLLDALNTFLLDHDPNKPVVIVIDDAQTMHTDSLEDLRLLSNLETDKQKLLQIVLAGQPELLDMLSQPSMRQLKQRVALTCRLDVLSSSEVKEYITRRLLISGDNGQVRFNNDALRRIYVLSGGIPRLINRICDYALTAGYVDDSHEIYRTHVKRAVKELEDLGVTGRTTSGLRRWMLIILLGTLVCSGAGVAAWYLEPVYLKPIQREPTPLQPVVQPLLIDTPEIQADVANSLPPEATNPTTEAPEHRVLDQLSSEEVSGMSEDIYIIRVASFKTMQRVEKATAQLHKQGIDSYWALVDTRNKGQWFGVYTGRFKTLEDAKKFKAEHELYESIIEHRYPDKGLSQEPAAVSKTEHTP